MDIPIQYLYEYEILPYSSHIQYAELLSMHCIVYKHCPKLLDTWQTNNDRDQLHDPRNQEHFKIPFPRIELLENPRYTVLTTPRMERTGWK